MRLNFAYKKPFYPKTGINENEYSDLAYDRLEKLRLFKQLRSEGCSEKSALRAISTSRATYYRWLRGYQNDGLNGLENGCRCPNTVRTPSWNNELEHLVLKIRKTYPLWGKYKIAAIIKRDHGKDVSISTVGRIISKHIAKGTIKSAHFYYSNGRRKRPRIFNKHAQRWKYGMKSAKPGELIQIDHMSVLLTPGTSVKHFQAICPFTKIIVEQAYSRATSNCAKDFLVYVKEKMPFPIRSIQVDGGSEFMAHFEDECQLNNIPLYVLPPRKPKYNGSVERGNGTAKYEFYYQYDGRCTIVAIRKALKHFMSIYNTFRPHQALQYQTPWQYYESLAVA